LHVIFLLFFSDRYSEKRSVLLKVCAKECLDVFAVGLPDGQDELSKSQAELVDSDPDVVNAGTAKLVWSFLEVFQE
jgi:hypothetical protein